MNNKKVIVLLIPILLIMSILPMISAAASGWFNMTLTDFANLTTGTNNVSVVVSVAAVYNVTNVTCYYNSSGGAQYPNSNLTRFNGIINTSAGQTSFTLTSTISTESSNLNLTCVLANDSNSAGVLPLAGGNSTISARNIKIDGTNPVATISKDTSNIGKGSAIRISWTTTDASSGVNPNGINVSLLSPDASRCPDLNYTADSATYSFEDEETACTGTYNFSVRLTDYSGNHYTLEDSFSVYMPGNPKSGATTEIASTGTGVSVSTSSIFRDAQGKISNKGVIILAIIGISAYMLLKKRR